MAREYPTNRPDPWVNLQLIYNDYKLPETPRLLELLHRLDNVEDDQEKKNILLQVVEVYESTDEQDTEVRREARDLILNLFTRFKERKTLKKCLIQAVIVKQLVISIIKETAEVFVTQIKEEKLFFISQCSKFLNFISLLQTTTDYDYQENSSNVFGLYVLLCDTFGSYAGELRQELVPELVEFTNIINTVIKQILPIFVKKIPLLNDVENDLSFLFVLLYVMLYNEKLEFSLRMKICLLFVHMYELLENKGIGYMISSDFDEFTIVQFDTDVPPNDYQLILYSAIVSLLPPDRLITEEVDEEILLVALVQGILDTARGNINQTSMLIEASRTLYNLVKHLIHLPLDIAKHLFSECLFFVAMSAEYFVDAVRNNAKLLFEELVALTHAYHKEDIEDLTIMIHEKAMDADPNTTIRFLYYENLAKYYGCDYLLGKIENVIELMMTALEDETTREQACKTYQALIEHGFRNERSRVTWDQVWVYPAIASLRNGMQHESICFKLMNTASNLDPSILRKLCPKDYIGSAEESKVVLQCLLRARKSGQELKLKDREEHNTALYWRGLIDKQKMDLFMIHRDVDVRTLALGAVCESVKSTELFDQWEFDYLIHYLRYNITTQLASMRHDMVSYYKKALTRFNAGQKVVVRKLNGLTKSPQDEPIRQQYHEIQAIYTEFIKDLMEMLISNLSHDSNFPRRATSLELLIAVRTVVSRAEWLASWTDESIINSHIIVFDTYENNKKMIVDILKTIPMEHLGLQNTNFIFKYVTRSLELAANVSPSKTSSAPYLLQLVSQAPHVDDVILCDEHYDDPELMMVHLLTKTLLKKINGLRRDGIGEPGTAFYGFILSIRHFLENRDIRSHNNAYKKVFDQLVTNCVGVGNFILPIVCNPAPEGFLPENDDYIGESAESTKSQMVIVFAWRTIKEITLVLAEMVKQTIMLENSGTKLLVEKQLLDIGDFFTNLFMRSKHRGVFEQAYVGFSVICDSFWKSTNPVIATLPKLWLQDTMDICTGCRYFEDLCATRRSAGLPFLILSILSDAPEIIYFVRTMESLLTFAQHSEDGETRTHCLNVLRAIYRHSKLAELVTPYVGSGVVLAIKGFKDTQWPIRNAATLLFSSLMVRMFGVQRTSELNDLSIKNKLTVRVFFVRYPELHRFILNTLAEECEHTASLVLMPILMILSRLYPSDFDGKPTPDQNFLPYLNVCLGSPLYRTREAAAIASVAMITKTEVKQHFDQCFLKLSDINLPENQCHGILLQVYKIAVRLEPADLPISDYLRNSEHILTHPKRKYSHMTVCLYMRVLLVFLKYASNYNDSQWMRRLLFILSRQTMSRECPYTWRNDYALVRTMLAYFIILIKLSETDITYSLVVNEIMFILKGHPNVMKKYCLQLIISMNQALMFSNHMEGVANIGTPTNLVLFTSDDINIHNEITGLIKAMDPKVVRAVLKRIHEPIKFFILDELRQFRYLQEEDRLLFFVLLDHYVCALRYVSLSKQETLNGLLAYCDNSADEKLICAVINCVGTFLTTIDVQYLNFERVVNTLSESAAPAATLNRRLTVADFLCKHSALFCQETPLLYGRDLRRIFDIVMVLLEDDDVDVRETISNFQHNVKVSFKGNQLSQLISIHKLPVIPEKVREDVLYLIFTFLPQEEAICMIFSWACRFFPPSETDTSEIFEKGGLNQYAENTPLIEICSRFLRDVVWELPPGVTYSNQSIFLCEQTQLVTALVMDSLSLYDSPMMLTTTKTTVIAGLRDIYDFVETAPVKEEDFVASFRAHFNTSTVIFLKKHLIEQGDLYCVKRMLVKLYEPVFNPELRPIPR